MTGVGRSGLVCLLIPAILDLYVNPTSIPDLTALAVKLSSARKNILRDREHLKFAYQAYLEHLKELRLQHGKYILQQCLFCCIGVFFKII